MMNAERRLEVMKQHKRWCDRASLYSLIVIVAIFLAMNFLMDFLGASTADRPLPYILLATIILATIIWNAAARAVVEVHSLLEERTSPQ